MACSATPRALPVFLQPGDLLIAADGGSRPLLALGLTPDILVGDFDSLDETEAARSAQDAGVEHHPPPRP